MTYKQSSMPALKIDLKIKLCASDLDMFIYFISLTKYSYKKYYIMSYYNNTYSILSEIKKKYRLCDHETIAYKISGK